MGLIIIGTTALVGIPKAQTIAPLVATATSISNSTLSSLDGIEMEDYGNPKQVLRYYAVIYGLNYEPLDRTVQGESSFRHEGLFGDNGKAYGISQFHRPTFELFCQGEYEDMDDQLHCMAQMFSKGLASHWSAYCKLYGC